MRLAVGLIFLGTAVVAWVLVVLRNRLWGKDEGPWFYE